MKKKEKQKSTTKQTIAKTNNKPVLILALALILAIILSIYAYSKYTSSYKGTSTSTVAKWSFKVNGHSDEEIGDIDFVQTIENQNNVVEKKLAPGTQGKFELTLDGTGSEVAIDYKIALTITEKPRNLKIYEDSEYKKEVTEQNGEFDITGSIPLEEVNTPLVKPVYWKWAYETGTTEEEIKSNDKIDTEDSKKSVTMAIKVTGTQRNPASLEPGVERLADVANIGDYVNYDANSGLVTPLTYTTKESVTGHSTVSTYSSSDTIKWRVLSVDKDSGKVELIAASNLKTLYLKGKEGYINSENILNDIGAIYGKGKGAVGGRSVNIGDIEKYSSYDPYTYTNNSSIKYGETRTYTIGTFVKGEGVIGGVEDTSDTRLVKASSNNPVTVTQTFYTYDSPYNYFENKSAYNVLLSGRSYFWLASRCVALISSNCRFGVRCADSSEVNGNSLFYSGGDIISIGNGVVPVVSLESDIPVDGKDTSGAWKLKIE